jgi:cell division protein FtsQ
LTRRNGPTFKHQGRSRRKPAIRGELLLDDATKRRLARRRMRRLSFACALVCAFGAAIGLYFSPLLRVEKVEVTGASAVSAEEIGRIANLDGESMLSVSFSEAEREIERLPLVRDATIERRWPNALRISISERAPWGVWQIAETPYVIDQEGVVLSGVDPPAGAPTVRAVASGGSLAAGDRVDPDAVGLVRALMEQVAGRLGLSIAGIEWTNASGLTLATDAGYRVVIGDSENVEYKLAVWSQVEAEMGREAMNGRVLDLRFGDRPALQVMR